MDISPAFTQATEQLMAYAQDFALGLVGLFLLLLALECGRRIAQMVWERASIARSAPRRSRARARIVRETEAVAVSLSHLSGPAKCGPAR